MGSAARGRRAGIPAYCLQRGDRLRHGAHGHCPTSANRAAGGAHATGPAHRDYSPLYTNRCTAAAHRDTPTDGDRDGHATADHYSSTERHAIAHATAADGDYPTDGDCYGHSATNRYSATDGHAAAHTTTAHRDAGTRGTEDCRLRRAARFAAPRRCTRARWAGLVYGARLWGAGSA